MATHNTVSNSPNYTVSATLPQQDPYLDLLTFKATVIKHRSYYQTKKLQEKHHLLESRKILDRISRDLPPSLPLKQPTIKTRLLDGSNKQSNLATLRTSALETVMSTHTQRIGSTSTQMAQHSKPQQMQDLACSSNTQMVKRQNLLKPVDLFAQTTKLRN